MMTDQHSHVFYRKHKYPKPVISHGEGIYLYDTSGKEYIDASGGAVVVNVGHGIQSIAEAIHQQAAQVAYAHATMFTSPAVEELSNQLAKRLPLDDARLFYMTSGSEATETAMKLARQIQTARGYESRYKIIARWGSYHGATLGALGITGKPSMRRLFEPMFIEMPHIPPVYCYHCPFGSTYPDCDLRCANALEEEITRQGKDTVAAFIAEPIAGATLGAVVPPDDYWKRIREICDQYDVLLIADEVMTGMGRTGEWFAIAGFDVSPDILCLGKGVSGGYVPLSATAAQGELVELLWKKSGDFNHGGTFSHQPVAAAAGLATIAYMEEHDLINRARQMGNYLAGKLQAVFGEHPQVGDIRGKGLMWALEFVADKKSKQPFAPEIHFSERFFKTAFEQGLITYAMSGGIDGQSGDHVMIAPPLIVTEIQVDEIVVRAEAILTEVTNAL